MSKKAVIRQNLFSGIFFITKKLAYEKKNKKNKHHFLSENCSTFFTRKFRAIKKILILVISIEAHLPTVRRVGRDKQIESSRSCMIHSVLWKSAILYTGVLIYTQACLKKVF